MRTFAEIFAEAGIDPQSFSMVPVEETMTEEAEDTPLFYTEDRRPIWSDEFLLKDACSEGDKFAAHCKIVASQEYERFSSPRDPEIEAIPNYWLFSEYRNPVSPSRSDLNQAIEDLALIYARGHGIDRKVRADLNKTILSSMDHLNFGRQMHDLDPITEEDVQEMISAATTRFETELDNEVCAEYVLGGVDIGHASWFDDDGDVTDPALLDAIEVAIDEDWEGFDEEARSAWNMGVHPSVIAAAERGLHQADPVWSEKATRFIFNVLDPCTKDPDFVFDPMDPRAASGDSKGLASVPAKFNGVVVFPEVNGYSQYPLRHHSVKQSLVWLTGIQSLKIRGFISDPRFTKADRADLLDFASQSWEAVKNPVSTF